ncbi:MAG: hypothetical protein JO357_09350 [Hyphomicrobiales bacterium]|nr:hypothetical protein [Hyphomicrobiales bacterium]
MLILKLLVDTVLCGALAAIVAAYVVVAASILLLGVALIARPSGSANFQIEG